MYAHAYHSLFMHFLFVALKCFFLYLVNMFINIHFIIEPTLILYCGFGHAECQLFGRIGNSSLLGEKAVLQRNVFTMEGLGRGNGVPCSSVGDREQDEVRKLKDFNKDGGCQYNK